MKTAQPLSNQGSFCQASSLHCAGSSPHLCGSAAGRPLTRSSAFGVAGFSLPSVAWACGPCPFPSSSPCLPFPCSRSCFFIAFSFRVLPFSPRDAPVGVFSLPVERLHESAPFLSFAAFCFPFIALISFAFSFCELPVRCRISAPKLCRKCAQIYARICA